MCIVGCRENSDCPSSFSCTANTCSNPCKGITCGPNSRCQAFNQTASCVCEVGFHPNPTAAIGCIREPARCASNNQCRDKFQCDSSFCKPICSTDSNCLPNELCINNLCSEICRSDNDCNSNEICQGVRCVKGCRTHVDCPSSQSCHSSKCIGKLHATLVHTVLTIFVFLRSVYHKFLWIKRSM